jgi:hypothetical protein
LASGSSRAGTSGSALVQWARRLVGPQAPGAGHETSEQDACALSAIKVIRGLEQDRIICALLVLLRIFYVELVFLLIPRAPRWLKGRQITCTDKQEGATVFSVLAGIHAELTVVLIPHYPVT